MTDGCGVGCVACYPAYVDALTQLILDSDPHLQELVALLHAAPPVAAHYTLSPSEEESGPLKPSFALVALRDAVAAYPKPLAWLLKKAKPKAPAQGQWGVQIGGYEEAWMYRNDTLALWQQLGAMDWLRDCARMFKQRG